MVRKVKDAYADFKSLSTESGIPLSSLMPILLQLELVELNAQLRDIHEHLDVHYPIKKSK